MAAQKNQAPSSAQRTTSRSEFHRFASNLLSESDFCTEYPSSRQTEKVATAINWTYKNEKWRNR